MVLVEIYISELLHYNDCVIVPRLGGFVANYKSVQHNQAQSLFTPPAKEIGFNRSLYHNDGLLADYIARKESVSFNEALEIIESFVTNVKSRINRGEVVELGEIGRLKGDAIGNLLFTPNEGSSFLPESFGLTSFRFEPLNYEPSVNIDKSIELSQNLKGRTVGYWSGVAAMVGGLMFLATFELKTPSVNEAGFKSIFESVNYSYVDNHDNQPSSVGLEIKKLTPSLTSSNHNAGKSLATDNRYHVIVASFPTRERAHLAIDQYKNRGFSDAVVVESENSSRFRISVESGNNRKAMISSMQRIRSQTEYNDAWVFRLDN
ncbi:SPOR domain-containing protein [Marinilabiliaceae bacterium ANBcel2]|nr:SPOR domain-containing protein [Marinilabiliaceae bacterium ANBcel2]